MSPSTSPAPRRPHRSVSGTRRRVLGAVAATGAALLALSACSSGGSASSATASSEAPSTFVVGTSASISTLDPNKAVDQAQLQILNLIGGTLTVFNEDYSDVDPGLADSWEVSDDGLTYTFQIADDLKFSDGTDLTAKDVAATLDWVINDEGSWNAGMVAHWASAEQTGDSEVVLTLNSPQESVLSLLADPEIGTILPADKLGDEEFYVNPISAGPYMLKSFDPTNGGATLVLNPNWTGATPAVPQIEFVYIQDSNTRGVQLKGGSIDLAENIPPNTLDQFTGDVEGTVTAAFGGNFLIPNDKNGILTDSKIRSAVSMAIDREQISEVIWAGQAKPLYQFWPNTSTLSDPVLPEGVDVEGAKELLKGTACENGCELQFAFMAGQQSTEDLAALLTEDLAAIGITFTPVHVEGGEMGTLQSDFTFNFISSGLYDYVDRADILLAQGLQSDGGTNALFSGYSSPEMDALIAQAVSATGTERADLMQQINVLFGEELPLIPLVDWAFVNAQNVESSQWVTFEPTGWLRVATTTD
ncbi:MAG: ABC transporter substrate-binding protein [Cellulomonas sp.]|nr:ABC transporter substrate-binding protein [Cellulomonas sp.]